LTESDFTPTQATAAAVPSAFYAKNSCPKEAPTVETEEKEETLFSSSIPNSTI
jgi:hypothetical protein